MQLAILGFGMIAGSVARALREREPGGWSVTAWSPSGTGPRAALADGVIDQAAADAGAAIDGADLIVLAAPPQACLALLGDLAGMSLAPGAVVTDVASTKRRIVARAVELGLPFVGGHPMAGTETSGYASADAALFLGRPWIVCGTGADEEPVRRLVAAVGGTEVRMDPNEHDATVAAVSHLPLVVSAALVEAVAMGRSPSSGNPRRLAAGGWAGMTRLARGDVDMGAGILATNADNVAARLRRLRDVLDEWIVALETAEPDVDALRSRLAAAREALEPAP